MRVIAGRLGGRRLKAPAGTRTRPTSERVREALFAMLEDVAGARVLDLFAGSGALGIEALSRGAGAAVFVERDPSALRALKENLRVLGLAVAPAAAGGPLAEVRRADAVRALRSARGREETYDLVFIDPPYDRALDLGRRLTAELPPLLAPGARVVLESSRRAPLALEMAVVRSRRYGDTSITIHRHDSS